MSLGAQNLELTKSQRRKTLCELLKMLKNLCIALFLAGRSLKLSQQSWQISCFQNHQLIALRILRWTSYWQISQISQPASACIQWELSLYAGSCSFTKPPPPSFLPYHAIHVLSHLIKVMSLLLIRQICSCSRCLLTLHICEWQARKVSEQSPTSKHKLSLNNNLILFTLKGPQRTDIRRDHDMKLNYFSWIIIKQESRFNFVIKCVWAAVQSNTQENAYPFSQRPLKFPQELAFKLVEQSLTWSWPHCFTSSWLNPV